MKMSTLWKPKPLFDLISSQTATDQIKWSLTALIYCWRISKTNTICKKKKEKRQTQTDVTGLRWAHLTGTVLKSAANVITEHRSVHKRGKSGKWRQQVCAVSSWWGSNCHWFWLSDVIFSVVLMHCWLQDYLLTLC